MRLVGLRQLVFVEYFVAPLLPSDLLASTSMSSGNSASGAGNGAPSVFSICCL